MRLTELERWLDRMGWQQEELKRGSHRHWTHADYPGQRLSYAVPHDARRSHGEMRPDVVVAIYEQLRRMKPGDDLAASA